MRKIITFTLALLALTTFANSRNDKDVKLHQAGCGNGYDQIYIEPPYVTYDDNLNELYVYFGSTGTIDLEYDDGTGAPYYYIYGESHSGFESRPGHYLLLIIYMVKATTVVILPLTPTYLRVTILLLSIVYMDTHIMETSLYPNNM